MRLFIQLVYRVDDHQCFGVTLLLLVGRQNGLYPQRFLGVLILALAFVGVFSIRNNLEDCMIAAVFGFIGFIVRRVDWPLGPIVLGMVLGSIMIERLTAGAGQVVTFVGLFSRWVSGTLAVVILGIIIFTIISVIMERRRRS